VIDFGLGLSLYVLSVQVPAHSLDKTCHGGKPNIMLDDWIDKSIVKAIIVSVVGGFILRSLLDKYEGGKAPAKCDQPYNPQSFPGVDRIWRIPLEPGLQGTLHTLAWMRKLVRRDVQDLHLRNFAERLVSECRGHDFNCEIETIFRFVQKKVVYRRDPVDIERVQDARRTLLFRAGDCDDKAVLLASLLACVGHQSVFSVLGMQPGNYSHVFVTVQTPKGWLSLDPTNEDAAIGWQGAAPVVAHYPIF